MNDRNSIRKSWSLAEDSALLQLVKKHGATGCWTKITLSMVARNGKQCRERYMNHLDPDTKKCAWTVEENNAIRDRFPEFGTKWSLYMPSLPGRSDNAIKNRYHIISRNNFEFCTSGLVCVAQKRPLAEIVTDDAEADEVGSPCEEQNRERLKKAHLAQTKCLRKLHVVRIALDREILELEEQCRLDDLSYVERRKNKRRAAETQRLSPSSSPSHNIEHAEEPSSEFDTSFDFDFEWAPAVALLPSEQLKALKAPFRSIAVDAPLLGVI